MKSIHKQLLIGINPLTFTKLLVMLTHQLGLPKNACVLGLTQPQDNALTLDHFLLH